MNTHTEVEHRAATAAAGLTTAPTHAAAGRDAGPERLPTAADHPPGAPHPDGPAPADARASIDPLAATDRYRLARPLDLQL